MARRNTTRSGSGGRSQSGAADGEAAAGAAPDAAGGRTGQFVRPPPQSTGAEQQVNRTGGSASPDRVGIALKVLGDPVARSSFSRVYSGQTGRRWGR